MCVASREGIGSPKIVYFMTVDKVKFRKPVGPGDVVEYHVKKIKKRGSMWWYACEAKVSGIKVAEAELSAMLVDG
ncbi:3-hydroxyacyl-[acyl-carrier-protein] dehydratase FabZ [Methylobrevis pamukkalensis]|uniref:3-hydroxyacyl-[acyl-carrier-protein] dehydratase FabZ n=1 Tax=Methylobrevis pamukkalensis TaxID=1439726 RepID=A0A1E3H4B4_9HYPH|nr:3-hydroxyacyl-[acyl-carrier-protein] dehydratase FabZ [Methylobrevis pamukkalensis]